MLILTRKATERVRIGDDISVWVMGIQDNQVRLGFDAPKSISVHREEIYQKIKNTILGQGNEENRGSEISAE